MVQLKQHQVLKHISLMCIRHLVCSDYADKDTLGTPCQWQSEHALVENTHLLHVGVQCHDLTLAAVIVWQPLYLQLLMYAANEVEQKQAVCSIARPQAALTSCTLATTAPRHWLRLL